MSKLNNVDMTLDLGVIGGFVDDQSQESLPINDVHCPTYWLFSPFQRFFS